MRKLVLIFFILMVNAASAGAVSITLTQGEETSRYLTFTNNDAYDTLYAWADASGTASAWVSPDYIYFGAVAPGETSSSYYYTIRVPDYQSPGYYELKWIYACEIPGRTCTATNPAALQITVKAKPAPTPIKQDSAFITLAQGEELTRYLSWTGAYERSFASAEASGDAALWVTPRRLDFGAVDPGDLIKRDFVIKVPRNQKPGYYELRWKYSCKYASGKTCQPTNDVVLQITVTGKTVPTPTPVEPSYTSLTVTPGEELSEYLTFTNNDAYDTLYAWAEASGDASSWVTPWRVEFGAVAPGETGTGYYAIRVPEYTSSGYYELIWKYGCEIPGRTCTTTSPTVVQIAVKGEPVLTPIMITKTPSEGMPAAVVLILVMIFIGIIFVALKGKRRRYEPAEAQEPGFKYRRRTGGKFQK